MTLNGANNEVKQEYIEPEVDPVQQVLNEDSSLIYWACRKETNLITSDKSKETRVSQPITSQSPVLRVRDIRDMTKNIDTTNTEILID